MKNGLYCGEDTLYDSYSKNYAKEILVLKPEALSEPWRTRQFQLFEAVGGFGCDPNNLGVKVFGSFHADGEEAQFCRNDFYGIATKETIEDWEGEYGKKD